MDNLINFDRNGNRAIAPARLVGEKQKKKNKKRLKEEYDGAKQEQRSMKFNSRIYGSKPIKDQLKLISYGKCSYCDRYIIDVQHCDVEHFRPKSKYCWIAYTWENLLLSCQICNQSFKSDKFPVSENQVISPNSDLALEQHLLINPVDEDPEVFFGYDDEGDEVSIFAKDNPTKDRVDACIDIYGLNRESLLDRRREKLLILKIKN